MGGNTLGLKSGGVGGGSLSYKVGSHTIYKGSGVEQILKDALAAQGKTIQSDPAQAKKILDLIQKYQGQTTAQAAAAVAQAVAAKTTAPSAGDIDAQVALDPSKYAADMAGYEDHSGSGAHEYGDKPVDLGNFELLRATLKQYNGLTQPQKDAILDYTYGPTKEMNTALLRANGDTAKAVELLKQHALPQSVFSKGNQDAAARVLADAVSGTSQMRLSRPTVLYRATDLSFSGIPNVGKAAKASDIMKLLGQSFTERAFGSTSISYATAESFQSGGIDRAILRIRAPADTKGAYVGDSGRTRIRSETEFIMAPNTTYTVRGASKSLDGTWLLDVDASN